MVRLQLLLTTSTQLTHYSPSNTSPRILWIMVSSALQLSLWPQPAAFIGLMSLAFKELTVCSTHNGHLLPRCYTDVSSLSLGIFDASRSLHEGPDLSVGTVYKPRA